MRKGLCAVLFCRLVLDDKTVIVNIDFYFRHLPQVKTCFTQNYQFKTDIEFVIDPWNNNVELVVGYFITM